MVHSDVRDSETLLESSWTERSRALRGRELRVELCSSAVFLATSLYVATSAAGTLAVTWPAIALVALYAIAARVDFPVGTGYAVPTQMFLMPILVVAPAAMVPLLVCGGLAAGTLVSVAVRRTPPDRLITAAGDAWYAMGPAVVLLATGRPDASGVPWWFFGVLFAAQVAFDFAAAAAREGISQAIDLLLQLRVMALVWTVDVMLIPVGVVVAWTVERHPLAPVALAGLLLLLFGLARDRDARIAELRVRADALAGERERLQEAVRRIGDAFASTLDLEALSSITLRTAVDALSTDAGRATVADRTIAVGSREASSSLGEVERQVAVTGRLAVVAGEHRSALAHPVMSGESHVGTIAVCRASHPFSRDETDLFAYLCEQVSIAATHAGVHEDLHRQASTDGLTGLANRQRLLDVTSSAIAHFRRRQQPTSLILLDVDNFKAINDTHGHLTGDRVLCSVAACLRKNSRATDVPARYGGEEFAILVDDGLEVARLIAERIRGELEATRTTAEDGLSLGVTASFGVAGVDAALVDDQELIGRADALLYDAKRAGKNRVRVDHAHARQEQPPETPVALARSA